MTKLLSTPALLRVTLLAFTSVNLYFGIVHYLPPVHLLWVIPLILYVVSLLIALTQSTLINQSILLIAKPFFVLPLLVPLTLKLVPNVYSYTLYTIVFFFLALVCNNEIIQERKRHPHIRSFLILSLGGAFLGIITGRVLGVGTSFQGLHLMLALLMLSFALPNATMVYDSTRQRHKTTEEIIGFPIALFLFLVGLRYLYPHTITMEMPIIGKLSSLYTIVYCVAASALCYNFRNSTLQFGLGVGAIIVCGLIFQGVMIPYREGAVLFHVDLTSELLTLISAVGLFLSLESPLLFRKQCPYGLIEVTYMIRNDSMGLLCDNVMQGSQPLDPAIRQNPISYYAPNGPFGQLWTEILKHRDNSQIAVIGLGIGTIAAYGVPGQTITFYEINPVMEEVARNPKFFTYLSGSKADIKVVIGDARHTLSEAPPHYYDVIINDAYLGGDAPKHLLTREAFELYSDTLKPHGILVINATTNDKALLPAIAKLTQDAGFFGVYQYHEPANTTDTVRQGKGFAYMPKKSTQGEIDKIIDDYTDKIKQLLTHLGLHFDTHSPFTRSQWVVIVRKKEDLAFLNSDARWRPLLPEAGNILWTDAMCRYNAFKRAKVSNS